MNAVQRHGGIVTRFQAVRLARFATSTVKRPDTTPEDRPENKADSRSDRKDGRAPKLNIQPMFVEGNIPFEGLRPSLPIDGPTTTLTKSEASTFRKLQDLITPIQPPSSNELAPSEQYQSPRAKPLSKLDALLDRSKMQQARQDRQQRHATDMASVRSKQRLQAKADEVEAVRFNWVVQQNDQHKARKRVIVDAKTDFELFRAFEDTLRWAVALEPTGYRHLPPEHPSPEVAARSLVKPLETIEAHLAESLLHIAGSYAQRFPRSPLILAILPELRRAGPAYFALGATTGLFNYALDYIIKRNEDISGALDLLVTMEREVIEPNEKTLAILLGLLERIRAIKRGVYGTAVKKVWLTERNRTAIREISVRAKRLIEMFPLKDRKGFTIHRA